MSKLLTPLSINNILIAGANGFIGTFLYGKLKSKFSLTGLGYSQESNLANYFPADLTDISMLQSFCNTAPQFDALIFLVGLAHKKGKGKEIDEYRNINKQTLVNLLTSLKKKNKLPRIIIFASTISVYGENMNQNVYEEDSSKNPISPYAITKLEAEEYLLEQFKDQSWILRFAPVYGGGFDLNINRRTRAEGVYYKVGNGQKQLSLCHLENIREAVLRILEGKVPAGVYNISDTNEYTYNDLLKYINAKWALPIPTFILKVLYYIGTIINSIFLKENATKLISDNIFPSDKIRKYTSLTASLNE
ncbi:MAG: hypothetical protein CMG74_11970 [Candidatus Marinimicrobia bacterium]|nr:hypothetical protein [Candidatus Neomarinimicrobiota bacterium]|tara:strand:- start:22163 stop:23077 length:915 start_codon:yes stop_codon:yes gene_type:complete